MARGITPYEGFRGAWGLPGAGTLTAEILFYNHLRLARFWQRIGSASAVAASEANAIGWASRDGGI